MIKLKTKTINPSNWGVSKNNEITYKYKSGSRVVYIEIYNLIFWVVKDKDNDQYIIKEDGNKYPIGFLHKRDNYWIASNGDIDREAKTRDKAVVKLIANLY